MKVSNLSYFGLFIPSIQKQKPTYLNGLKIMSWK